jgi:hypothetical protein
VSIELSGETENRDLIETAVRRFLERSSTSEGRFRKLRRRIEESGRRCWETTNFGTKFDLDAAHWRDTNVR